MKLVVVEEGSDEAGAVWDASDLVITSRLSYVEARAALAAARRARRLSQKELEEAKSALDARFQEIDLIEVTQHVARSAADLAERHGLRGYDAVHLASILAFDVESVVLATWDRELGQAGRAEGFDLAGIRLD
ncbi:MAG: type II toxin-antitoxin system VapC family toxin [Acidobacteria bacterium]|nr:type II toxin-antitoxin system VapC family toxin [Acidobacteriota bacterium]